MHYEISEKTLIKTYGDMHHKSINRRFKNPQHHLTLILGRRFSREGGTVWEIFCGIKVLISYGNMHDLIVKAFFMAPQKELKLRNFITLSKSYIHE